MTFFPDVESLDKLLNNHWKSIVYGEKSETWNEKIYSIARQAWTEIFVFLDSQGRQLKNNWLLYAALFVGLLILFATYKSLRYVRTIELRKIVKCEQRGNEEIRTDVSAINSNDGNVDVDNLSENPRSIFRSDVDDATASSPAINCDGQPESGVSSDTAVIAVDGNESGEFLKNFINSIPLGDDAIDPFVTKKQSTEYSEDNEEIIDLPVLQQEYTGQTVDTDNCKQFNVPSPRIKPSEGQQPGAPVVYSIPDPVTTDCTSNELIEQRNSTSSSSSTKKTIKNATDHENRVEPGSRKSADLNVRKTTSTVTANSTLAINHDSSSVCCADELLSRTSDTGDNDFSSSNTEKPDVSSTNEIIKSNCDNLEVVFINFVQKLPELDLSPITRQPVKIDNEKNKTDTKLRTDSNQRFRSLSHDNQTASNGAHIDTRRGSSVSPPARQKNKQRFVTQMQSKIPTLTPLAHRTLHGHVETDGKVEETANQIRSVLLRKLKQVWEQHPRDRTPSPNRSLNSSLESSIYYTPECVSKIPLPRRSPRNVVANEETHTSRVGGRSARSANYSEQPEPGCSGITNEPRPPDDEAMGPLHSTPKISPLSRDGHHGR